MRTPSLRDRTVGAWLTSDRRGVIAGVAASALHGAQWVDPTEPIELLVDERRRQRGLQITDGSLARLMRSTTVADLPVTTPARTAFDLGRYLDAHARPSGGSTR